jgi:hypothetical protein
MTRPKSQAQQLYEQIMKADPAHKYNAALAVRGLSVAFTVQGDAEFFRFKDKSVLKRWQNTYDYSVVQDPRSLKKLWIQRMKTGENPHAR